MTTIFQCRHRCHRATGRVRPARLTLLTCIVVVVLETAGAAQDVINARQRYNEGRFDEAVAAAEVAYRDTSAGSAAVVLARAKLERFRVLNTPSDLDEARTLLRGIDPSRLSRAERIEWEVGVASALYLQGRYGPAAELFGRLLREAGLPAADWDRLVDWWASAVDRVAQTQPREVRVVAYERLASRLEDVLGRYPTSAASTYWLAVATRGAGDLERAWNLVLAGWVRAPQTGRAGDILRGDLDLLMLQGVIPDLAVERTDRPAEDLFAIAAMAEMAGEWEALKAEWGALP